MAETKLMRADDIASGFNGVVERKYWRAAVAGSRVNPEVHFNSRASMVQIAYRITEGDFAITFSKTSAAFGDYMASAYRSMEQILASLKAAGLPFASDLGGATLRLEYVHASKVATVYLANLGDAWPEAEPLPFKVPARENTESGENPLDGPKYGD